MHTNSKLLFEKHVKPILNDGMRILEIGPDSFPSTLQRLSGNLKVACWDTLDIYGNPNLTYQSSQEYEFKIQSDSYDVVLSAQVIEHVKKPWMWFPELARVTKPGGLVITIAPISYPFHEAPVDCWRIYPDGMKALFEEAGLISIFSCWESLEIPGYKRYTPGISIDGQSLRKLLIYKILGRLGLPLERSYDVVTIGKKIGTTEII